MARPTKSRRICRVPDTLGFSPIGADAVKPGITLTLDEYETIRLIDHAAYSQEACSAQMGISRTTVQKIYDTARLKLAKALVEGLTLTIAGGTYAFCEGDAARCRGKECFKRVIAEEYALPKGEYEMRIAVTYDQGLIFQHFGHTEQFKVYDVVDGKVKRSQVVSTNGQGHGALAEVLRALKADVLICGGIGGGAKIALAQAGITLYGGVSGSADAAVEAFLKQTLSYNPDVHCDHHTNGEGHDCASHSCTGGGCGHHE